MNKVQQLAKSVMEEAGGDDIATAKRLARLKVAMDAELRDALLDPTL